MRTILFKGKRKDNGDWVEGDLVHLNDGCIIITESNLIEDDDLPNGHDLVYSDTEFDIVDPSTVCQYTGLNDKDGNMIFEGDIIKIHEGKDDFKTTTIIWNDKYALYVPSNKELRYDINSDYSEYYEIIGNIHDKK